MQEHGLGLSQSIHIPRGEILTALQKLGRLEVHVPAQYTPQQPAVTYSHESSFAHIPIENHPVASKLPKATSHPSIQPTEAAFLSLGASPDCPATIEQMIARNLPQLLLHIMSFANATLVGLTWPHTVMDAVGLEDLLRAWSLVLAGREADVPRVLGAREDVLWKIAGDVRDDDELVAKTDSYDGEFEAHRLRGWSGVWFLVRFLWDAFRTPVERKLICLPKAALAKLRATVEQEQDGDQNTFVSESDVMTAWAARIIAQSEGRGRSLTVVSAVNVKFRLAKRLDPGPGVYLQNLVLGAFTFLTAKTAEGPLRSIAEAHRGHLAAQTSEGRILRMLKYLRKGRDAGKESSMRFYGRADSVVVTVNNLTKINMLGAADFGPAVVNQAGDRETGAGGSEGALVGRTTYWHFQGLQHRFYFKNRFVILGKDHDGNSWVMATLGNAAWAAVENELQKL